MTGFRPVPAAAVPDATKPDAAEPASATGAATRFRRYGRRLLVAVICAVVAAATVALVGPRDLGRQIEISFVRQPTSYTELYFANPEQLPPASAAEQPSTVWFTVRSHGSGVVRYHCVVSLAVGGRTVTLAEETFAVGDGQALARMVTVPPVGHGTTYRVTVALTGTTDSIDFEGTT